MTPRISEHELKISESTHGTGWVYVEMSELTRIKQAMKKLNEWQELKCEVRILDPLVNVDYDSPSVIDPDGVVRYPIQN